MWENISQIEKKKNQIENVVLKRITKWKIHLEGLNNRFELAEERKDKADDRSIEIIHSVKQKVKRMKKKKQSLTDLWDSIKFTNICITEVSEGQEEEKGVKTSQI